MVGFGWAAVFAAVAAVVLVVAILAYESYKARGWEAARPTPRGLGEPLRTVPLDGGKWLTVYDNGCAKHYATGVVEWARWTAVADVEIGSTPHGPTPHGEGQHAIGLELHDGTRIFLCGPSDVLAPFAEDVCEKVYAIRLAEHRARVHDGGVVKVRRTRGLEIDAAGLRRHRRRLPWAHVDAIEVDRGGYVRFRRHDAVVNWAGFPTGGPGQRAYLQLARELYAEHHAGSEAGG